MSTADIIRESLEESGTVQMEGDAPSAAEGESAEPVVEETSGDAPAESGDAPAQEEPSAAADDLAKELESLGIKPPAPGQRENRLPYSRVRKVVENAQKKLRETHEKELETHKKDIADARERLRNIDNVERLIADDPDRYLSLLAKANPKYSKFLNGATSQGTEPTAKAKDADPMPQPDAQFADGTTGYSPEGLEKLFEWRDRRLERRIQEQSEQKYGPLVKEREAQQVWQQEAPKIHAQIDEARKTWGPIFDESEAEITKAISETPANVPFERIVASVLVPKLQNKVKSARTDTLKDINSRPAAATRSAPGGMKAAASGDGPKTTAEVIKAELARLKG